MTDAVTLAPSTAEEGGVEAFEIHGGFMVLAWGFFLPLGVLSARLLRHRPEWFYFHCFCQVMGYLLALVGLTVAFAAFGNIFTDPTTKNDGYRHGAMGLTTMVFGFSQLINGTFRPVVDKQPLRGRWEIIHKILGYSTIILAFVTMYLGVRMAGGAFYGAFGTSLGFCVAAAIVLIIDKRRYSQQREQQNTSITGQGIEIPIEGAVAS
mmetsp:Transcript_20518/g.47463  ORF Transcript_20518/g.47463 Transcript_20518/m.47463 type:complete len:208 (-) Transcript_20518:214-837(-)